MPSLRVVNVVLVGASLLCVGIIVTQLARSGPTVDARARPPAAAPAAPAPAAETSRLPAQAYSVIATRNLFSPTRTETPGTGAGGGPAISIAKPSLHGVVLREGSPIAYLEDPMTKRIAGYRIGDLGRRRRDRPPRRLGRCASARSVQAAPSRSAGGRSAAGRRSATRPTPGRRPAPSSGPAAGPGGGDAPDPDAPSFHAAAGADYPAGAAAAHARRPEHRAVRPALAEPRATAAPSSG
jgi:hypothetical protein